jgi:hypothetical protein
VRSVKPKAANYERELLNVIKGLSRKEIQSIISYAEFCRWKSSVGKADNKVGNIEKLMSEGYQAMAKHSAQVVKDSLYAQYLALKNSE